MKSVFLFILLILISSCSALSHSNVSDSNVTTKQDTLKPTTLELFPPAFEIPKPDGKFVTRELIVKNTGENLLVISKVNASCYCGSSTVLNSRIEPNGEGKILLNVNLAGLYGDNNIVQFSIHSNAAGSPTVINMTILPATKDSTEKK